MKNATLFLSIFVFGPFSFAKKPRFIVKYKDGKVKSVKNNFSKIQADGEIEYVEEDLVLKKATSDSGWSSQWGLRSPKGFDMGAVWGEGIDSSGVVVAVVDTGVIYHEDLQGKILPGFDFISDPEVSGDGGGRDSEPLDVGDAITRGESCWPGFDVNSSWHGTHVAGIVAANIDNGLGMAGVSDAKILPLRVLGKCGGLTSDIADAVRWASGGSVSGAPSNPNPAKVINMSLGGSGPCPRYMQEAIDFARSQGATVVVSAGNSGQNIDYYLTTPANCKGVIVVGSSNEYGEASSFSNYGETVDIYAPGEQVYSLGDKGSYGPAGDTYYYKSGTSMAAPMIAGLVSLMYAENDQLYPDQIESILESTAVSRAGSNLGSFLFPAAYAAILSARRTPGDPSFESGEPVSGSVPLSPSQDFLYPNEERKGGLCGNINDISSGGGGSPKGPFSLLMILLAMVTILRVKARQLSCR